MQVLEKSKIALGIDLGGTNLRIAIVSENGSIIAKKIYSTDKKGGFDAIVEQIRFGVEEILPHSESIPKGIGIGVAGMIDPSNGLVLHAPNLQWKNVSLVEKLNENLDFPIRLINDVRAITLAEQKFGAGKNVENSVFMIIGTGLGGGVISNGSLMKGAKGNFGEIGHFVIDRNGPICSCGSRGCLETYVGGWGIAKRASLLMDKEMTAKEVIEKYHKKDDLAVKIIQEAIEALVAGLQTVIYAYNPEKIIFGGGIVHYLPDLVIEAQKKLKLGPLKSIVSSISFAHTALKDDGGVIGAASLFFE